MKPLSKADLAALTQERTEAWIGDAVLALFAREWLLETRQKIDGEAFVRFTSNDFLRTRGNPTRVEAEIGRIYQDHGLDAAFEHLRTHLLPTFEQMEKRRRSQRP